MYCGGSNICIENSDNENDGNNIIHLQCKEEEDISGNAGALKFLDNLYFGCVTTVAKLKDLVLM